MNAIILARAEQSRRLGKIKPLLKIGDKSLIEIMLDKISGIFDRIFIVTTGPELFRKYENTKVEIVEDRYKCGPLGGICSGLEKSDALYNFVLAVDMVFLTPDLLLFMMKKRKGYEILAPATGNHVHLLCAIYQKTVKQAVRRKIRLKDYTLSGLLTEIKVRYLRTGFEKFGSPEILFFNLNTQSDLAMCKMLNQRQVI